ncbi:hypothetical protein J2S90_000091 [Arthrobacter bambusae]|uniref:Uncharacterized protein n=1 Tax=Arthrobacter bambusae TaxID=1338426 RepID=A0AAW8DCK0_9MICC|nr:hypothetical protein [Arthrobacter bambusae]MDQ0128855.1 hypothetical protein [Arthrobacter bambusae]MDQ0180196.1 hypothetical protein [Arthrobacter bambusae]
MAAFKTPPCPSCGVWECLDCGARANRRNRYFPGKHHCTKCRSFNGVMLPTRHRLDVYENHVEELDQQATCFYPLEQEQSEEGPSSCAKS